MNRPTIDVEELLEMADEALAAGDTQGAISILRKAVNVAPLRKDVRNQLAMVLEGTPVKRRARATAPVQEYVPAAGVTGTGHELESDYAGSVDFEEIEEAPRVSIEDVARRAFASASEKTQRAGEATRRLSNLLQNGFSNLTSFRFAREAAVERTPASVVDDVSAQEQVFQPESELQSFFDRTVEDETFDEAESDGAEPEMERLVRPAPVSRKSASTTKSAKKSSGRATDVEDVLAAGVGGFIEAISRVEKSRFVYAFVYTVLIGFFGYACFDVSKKFPAGTGSGQLAAASLAFDGAVVQQPELDIVKLRAEVAKLKDAREYQQADDMLKNEIEALKSQLVSGKILTSRDVTRRNLIELLDMQGEVRLTASQFGGSVASYEEALKVMPDNSMIQLHLANALFYQGTQGTLNDEVRRESLSKADSLLTGLRVKDAGNASVNQLQELVREKRKQ